ncbi:MAG: ribosome small subunit-dependent GTPase A [Lachnospiraceae bacterium]|nr:ribosome small subunit-dependent GTPase A [Lachnospiraceae bacterium]
MTGRIIKGIGGFYYVHTGQGIYTCKAKGIFRHDKTKPLVGDTVDISEVFGEEMTGNITRIHDRKNVLIRPNVANVDQALIIFSFVSPEPNFLTLDKMILQYKAQGIPVLVCFNKDDLTDDTEKVAEDYGRCGCRIVITSAREKAGIKELGELLRGRTTTVAGPSGVGKSSIINCLTDGDLQKTGEISKKLERGKHTTRHSEIIPITDNNTYIIDTPGFSSFDLSDITPEDLPDYYEEFKDISACRFMPCSHTHEPGCAVKEAVAEGRIPALRYDNYVYIRNELTRSRRY